MGIVTEQELKEYAWEIGERFEHLSTALGRLDYHEQLNAVFVEMLSLKLTKHECIDVLATVFRDYDIKSEMQLLPAFTDIHIYVRQYLFDLERDRNGSLKVEIGFGRRPE